MYIDNHILLGRSDENVYLEPRMANRHGLIAGATGTGKTITLEVLAEAFSEMGVPVFLADVKGDIAGLCRPGQMNDNIQKRLTKFGITDFEFKRFPVRFFDVYGEGGHPVRTTISEMGPLLLSRLLGLTEVQEGVLSIVFRIADDNGLLLIDLKDLRAILNYVGQHAAEYTTSYGNVTKQSLGAIQRALLQLEDEGGDKFFGEPDLKISDWMQTDANGKGYINILHCVKLFQHPLLYSTFLLWMLSELFEDLPELGDVDKPRMVFFFDEAHLLFKDAPKALITKVEQVVKLIRSKGVGVYFVTQNPSDIPDSILAQLGNRIQHALRAYTPAEQKAVRAAAKSFRENPAFKTEDVISDLGVGEALVSLLDKDGIPGIVQRCKIICPQSSMSAITDDRRQAEIEASDLYGKYERAIDRQSAYEDLMQVAEREEQEAQELAEQKAKEKEAKKAAGGRQQKSAIEKGLNSGMSSVTRQVSGNIVKSLTGGKTKSAKSIAQQAGTSILSTILREAGNGLLRGLFGTMKK